MEEEALRGVQWQTYGETVLNPYACAFVALMAILLLALPRRFALLPCVAVALYITNMQRIVIADLDFFMLRIMVLIAFLRIVARAEYRGLHLTGIDYLVFSLSGVIIITRTALLQTTGIFINRLGCTFDLLGMYFTVRILVRSFDDIGIFIKGIILMSLPLAFFMTLEQITGINRFSALGGVPEAAFVRGGRIRSQGAFSHPILAGTFGASSLALAAGLLLQNTRSRLMALTGIAAATIITIMSASSGPIITYLAAVAGFCAWPMRRYLKPIVWSCIAFVALLQLVMKANVWWLITRFKIVSGSTGSHRAMLLDAFFERFDEWWLIGTPSSGHWGWGLEDVTNMFVRMGIDAGLAGLLLFLAIIFFCFKSVGRSIRASAQLPGNQKLLWALGVYLFSHVISFMGVSYFSQMPFFYYTTIALISSVDSPEFKKNYSQ
ncbi:MAG: hypothetical protein JW832_04150 [Deltaproteobacteria bacterium]|nr:hypothetical protein [Deltaproteobacteria bacterium]